MELRDYFLALRRHAIAIVLLVAVGLGAAYGWTKMQTPIYEASASGFAKSTLLAEEGTAITPAANDSLAKSKVPTFVDMATWRTVAEHAAEELGLDTRPEDLVRRISVTNPEGTAILKITATGTTPESARALAEAWVNGLIVTIDTNDGDGTPGSAPVTVILGESASLPTSPAFPDTTTSLLIGGLLGLGAGIAFAIMRAISDRRIRPGDDVEQRLGVSVLGTIPQVTSMGAGQRLIDPNDTHSKSGFAVTESLRTMRTNLQFMDVDNPPRRIVVTSPLPGEGKSTVAANLAAILAANGEHVALVDGDLRRPTVANTMGLVPGAGLTDVLAGRAELIEVLQRAPKSPGLVVLGAGTIPPNPSELLGSARMRAVLDELAQHAIVIIDAPPLLPVTDGAILTHQADGAILVVTVGKTTYDLVEKAFSALEKVSGRLLGVVLNRAPLTGAGAKNYAYQYRSRHAETPEAEEQPPAEPKKTPTASRPKSRSRRPQARRGRSSVAMPPQPIDAIDDEAALQELFGDETVVTPAPKRTAGGTGDDG
ncbi:polysaccharide biosynthesis tyrosine autokinase [Microbacterium sp.]|uniref:polysaccharide biosynthesis tyrosine autokinase n=1 Tax=Microbacterium sp. TaxID=51671 RepID=UPI0028125600|nr:polysaccharide biosynthesis tyrosine autokinase [Microbacterium sp.]